MKRATCALMLAVGFMLMARTAFAQTENRAAAEALFQEGRRLLAEGRHSEACPKFVESHKLDPAPGTLLNLADCYERAGLTASAWLSWLDAAAAANTAKQPDRERFARERAAALKSRLVSVAVVVPGTSRIRGLEVQRDGVPLGLASWGTAVPVDPGSHTVTARAPGRKPWQTTVTVVDGVQPVQVTVPLLELETGSPPQPAPPVAGPTSPVQPAPAAAPPAGLTQPLATSPPPDAAAPTDAGSGSPQATIGYVAGAAGLVAAVVGTVFGVQAISKNNESKKQCTAYTTCNVQGWQLRKDARRAATVSTVGFSVAAVGVVGGIILIATAPRAKTSPSTAVALSVRPGFGPSAAEIALNGAF
jgi:hypothetical protein